MSIRLEMLGAATCASKVLGDSTGLVRDFLLAQQNPDGGFKNRAGRSDLYYLPFGLAGLAATAAREGFRDPRLEQSALSAIRYLTAFDTGSNLDFVHLCSLARGWAAAQSFIPALPCPLEPDSILERLEQHRTTDGGYHADANSISGSAYGAFLALGAYQDLGVSMPEPARLGQSLAALQTPAGGYRNDAGLSPAPAAFGGPTAPSAALLPPAATNPTAAVLVVLRQLEQPGNDRARNWLLARLHVAGGFAASATAPAPDLLSTATALHALVGLPTATGAARERCLDFVDSLWTNTGGFYGYWGDDCLDSEYTFYALLALGHLAA